MPEPEEALVGTFTALLQEATARAAAPGPCSLLYSGGVDSSVLAVAARPYHPSLVAVGLRDSHDLAAARTGAALLGLPLIERELTPVQIGAERDRWADYLRGADGTARAVTVGLAAATEASPTERVLCGQGADELFLGYAHFRDLSPAAAAARRVTDLDRLDHDDWPRAGRIAQRLGRELRAPFLDRAVVDAVLATPPDLHLPNHSGAKPVLRAIALAMGVPPELARRPKKAFQFGSGIARALRGLEPPPHREAPITR